MLIFFSIKNLTVFALEMYRLIIIATHKDEDDEDDVEMMNLHDRETRNAKTRARDRSRARSSAQSRKATANVSRQSAASKNSVKSVKQDFRSFEYLSLVPSFKVCW